MSTPAQTPDFIPADPQQQDNTPDFIPAQPTAAAPPPPAQPQSWLRREVLNPEKWQGPGTPYITGGWKELQRQAGNLIDTFTRAYTGDKPAVEPTGPLAKAIQAVPNTLLPGAPLTRMLPEAMLKPIRKTGEATADYLKRNTELQSGKEEIGALGTNILELAAAPEGEALDALDALGEHFESLATLAKAAKKPGLAGASARVTINALGGGAKNAAIGTSQEYLSSEDPNRAATVGLMSGAIGTVMDPVASEAAKYISDLRSGTISRSSGLIDKLLPPMEEPVRPVKGKTMPLPSKVPLLPPKPVPPLKPELETVPPKPPIPPPIVPAERPEMPIRPAPIPKPAPVEPTPVPEPPVYTAPDIPARAPMAERAAAMETQTAQGTLADKYAQEAQIRAGEIGDPDTAAQHLESLNAAIEHENFANLPEDQQAQMLKDRQQLLQRAQPAADSRTAETMLDQVGTFGNTRDAIQARAKAAYQDWGAKTNGTFTTLNDEYQSLRGRFDADSLKAKAKNEADFQALYKKTGVASPIDRAVYRSQLADGYVLDAADKVFQNAYKGAARTGEFDEQALQRNWKSFVNKNGQQRVKNLIGDERYETMNAFINDLAGESDADKAAQIQAKADFEAQMKVHKQTVQDAQTLDEARQAALDAKHEAAKFAQKQIFEDARIKAEQGINQAKATDQAAKVKRAQDITNQISQWQEDVLKANNLNDAKQAAYKSERDTYKAQQAAYRRAQVARGEQRALADIGKANAEEYNKAVADAHDQAMGEYRDDLDRFKDQQRRRKVLMNLGKYGWIAGGAAGGFGSELNALFPNMPTPIRRVSQGLGTALVLSSIMMNPRVASVAAFMARTGGRPEIYWPIIHGMLLDSGTTPAPEEDQTQEKP